MSIEETSLVKTARMALVIGGLLVAAVAVGWSVLFPVPLPAKSIVFGCYTTALAAPIKLDAGGMDILQDGFPHIGFHLESNKTGIALTAEAPIVADPFHGRYFYHVASVGEGWYLDFFEIVDGRRHGVFDERKLVRFTMLTSDGVYLPYEKASMASCANGRS